MANTFIISEIGINHNGDLDIAKKMICASKEAGADAVKFQKRTVDLVYSKEQLAKPRVSPFIRPFFCKASIKYSEHVGKYLHLFPSNGEIKNL